jgi:hypothetical protein
MGKCETLIYEKLWKKDPYNILMKTRDGKNEGFLVTVNINNQGLMTANEKNEKNTLQATQ